jgi:hypothetical protein
MRTAGLANLAALAALLLLVGAGCAGGNQAPSQDPRTLSRRLAELDALHCPDGCQSDDWAELKGAFRDMLLHPQRHSSSMPQAERGRPIFITQASPFGGDYVSGWWYVNRADYDQNGLVNVSDLSPLGAHLNETSAGGPFNINSRQSAIDGDNNGVLNIADLSPLGAGLDAGITGYKLYTSDDPADVPGLGESGENGFAGTVALADAIGNKTQERIHFDWPISVLKGQYVWIRPYEGVPQNFGERSAVFGDTLTVTTADALGGTGTPADPYIIAASSYYALKVASRFDGDFTDKQGIEYTVSDSAGSVNTNTLATNPGISGAFNVGVKYTFGNGSQIVGGPPAYFHVGGLSPPTAAIDAQVTSGTRPFAVSLNAGNSFDDLGISNYDWDLDGDGIFETSSGPNAGIDHTFFDAGSFNVGLRVTDTDGLTDEATLPITVEGQWTTTYISPATLENINGVDMVIAAGRPALIWWTDLFAVKYLRANDADGLDWPAAGEVALFGSEAPPVLQIADGVPAVFSTNPLTFQPYVQLATDPNGTAFGLPITIDTTTAEGIDAATVNGQPALAWTNTDDVIEHVYFKRADNASGSLWTTSPIEVASATDTHLTRNLSMAMVNGAPGIAYADLQNYWVYYSFGIDATGTAWQAGMPAGEYSPAQLYEFLSRPLVCFTYGVAPNWAIGTDPQASTWSSLISPEAIEIGDMRMLALNGQLQFAYADSTDGFVHYALATDEFHSQYHTELVPGTGNCAYLQMLEVNGHPAILHTGTGNSALGYSVFH